MSTAALSSVSSAAPSAALAGARQTRRAFWLKQLHTWHWVSSAVCLIGMLLFAVTGITLNHAGQIEARPRTTRTQASLPDALTATLAGEPASDTAPLPPAVSAHIAQALALDVSARATEWSDDEVYVALPRPGGDAFLTIDRASGDLEYEVTDRGWVSYLNDLHKGRNTGLTWQWFLDVFAGGCLVFCITGLFLLQLHARQRAMTWPVVGLGLVVPLVIALILIH